MESRWCPTKATVVHPWPAMPVRRTTRVGPLTGSISPIPAVGVNRTSLRGLSKPDSARFDCVALAGPVHGVTVSATATPINHYMTIEGILNPPMDADGPQAIVTANAAVCASAFRTAGGFDASYPFASGEDLDLGLKLRLLGSIHWARHAIVCHRFVEDVDDFTRRFVRYGKGTAHLEHRLNLPSIKPSRFIAHDPALQGLADLQIVSMRRGYEQHRGATLA